MALELTDGNIKEIINSGKPVVVDFWAEWCGPCKAIGPIIEELSKEYEGKATIGKLNVDDNPEVSFKYGIRSIPTLLFIKNGEVVEKHVGAASRQVIASKIEANL